MNKINFTLLTVLIFLTAAGNIFSQSEWKKWGKADYSYELPSNEGKRDYSLDEKGAGNILLKSAADAYWIFISDVDGDNCSFSPTCSSFFLQAVHQTDIVQGALMFFDRFTRDMDIYKKYDQYPRVKDGHFYDPPALYTLNKNKIKYLPPSEVVDK